MADSERHEGPAPIAVIQYELTDDIAIQSALDLLEHRAPKIDTPVHAFRGVSPVVVLVAAAAQIVVAMAAVIVLGGRGVVSTVLVAAGVLVTLVLLWKAAFYSLPSMARWVVRRGAIRQARGLTDRRIRWLLFEDRLETESASAHRRVPWSDVAQMTRAGRSFVLSLQSRIDLVIPASALSAEVQSFITGRVSGR
jgi:hypothetical protein